MVHEGQGVANALMVAVVGVQRIAFLARPLSSLTEESKHAVGHPSPTHHAGVDHGDSVENERFGRGGRSNSLKSPVERASTRVDTDQPYPNRRCAQPLDGLARAANGNLAATKEDFYESSRLTDNGSSLCRP